MTETADLVAGRFRLTGLLGTGGSASVFQAVDQTTGATVALKLLHPHLTGRPAAREFFLAEARRAGALRHPRIASVLDVGVDEAHGSPQVWIALELVPGRTLSEHVRSRGPLDPRDAVVVADAVLEALAAAHERGLVHRDVSPSNVMLDTDATGRVVAESVRLLDFGIAGETGQAALGPAALLSAAEDAGVGVLGNARYLSPEQLRGEPVDERGDLYQVGAVLYFALVGRAPFARQTSLESARAHLDAPPPVPSVSRRGVPRALDRIVVRAMLKSPDDRYPDAEAMRRALAEAAGLPPLAEVATGVVDAADASPGEPLPGGGELASRTGVTRVLGTTMATRRVPVGGFAPPPAVRRARRSGGIAVLSTVAAAVVLGVAISFVTSPSASVTTDATPAPTTAPPPPAVTSTPTVEPRAEAFVPNLDGLTLDEARAALENVGLVAGDIVETDGPWPQGRVVETDPSAETRVLRGSAVAIVAASGFAVVPAVAGRSRQDAVQAVAAAGFFPTTAASAEAGEVVGTSPAQGSRHAVGSTVTILEAPPAQTPTPTPTPTPLPTSSPVTPAPTPQPTVTP